MPFIDIVPVGPAGAGKSCLLAAMNQGLKGWEQSPAPVLKPDPVTALVLEEVWQSRQVRGTECQAGVRHRGVVDLWFEAGADGGGPLFETRLADYDGGAVAVDRHAVGRALAARVRGADAVLCVLDGERVAGLLDGDRDGFDQGMAAVWKLVVAPRKVVRFVVTKWDVLEGRASLAQVRDALLGHPGFAMVLRRLSACPGEAGTVALIPVSVAGEDAGQQAVVPLMSVLSQALRAAAGRAERSAGRGGALVAGVGMNWLSQAVTAVAVQQVLQRVVDAVPERRAARRYVGHAATGASMLVEAAVRTWCERGARPADDQAARAGGKPLTRAAEAYEWQLREFHRRFPDADLTGAVSPPPRLLRRLLG
ncbi:hypothetical protein [Saccharothrix xinjiangensis]|uniref:Dynamin family protein n=1 Tax=Saccharothrix xinjiangensis TaxID=204798 RepID=A0ABV9YFC5_9PSEU